MSSRLPPRPLDYDAIERLESAIHNLVLFSSNRLTPAQVLDEMVDTRGEDNEWSRLALWRLVERGDMDLSMDRHLIVREGCR